MGLVRERHNKRRRWAFLPVVLLLLILYAGSVSSADEEQMKRGATGTGIEIYVDGTRAANGTGTQTSPFHNMEDAINSAGDGSIIWITGTVTVNNGENKKWSIDPEEKPNVAVMRHKDFEGIMVKVDGGALEAEGIVFDGNKAEADAKGCIIWISGGMFHLQSGGIIRNNSKAGSEGTILEEKGTGIYGQSGAQIRISDGEISGNTGSSGAGIQLNEDCEMVITNSCFHSNESRSSSGGAISAESSEVKINSGSFYNNKSSDAGGAIFVSKSNITINGTELYDNRSSRQGGAVYTNESDLTINNGKIYRNTSSMSGGGIHVAYGKKFEMEGGEISNNTVYGTTGTVLGGGISLGTVEESRIKGVRIIGNQSAGDGGGIACNNGQVWIEETEIADNIADRNGGGLCNRGNSGGAEIQGGEFTGNEAGNDGGAIWTATYDRLSLDSVSFYNNTALEAYFWTVDPTAIGGNSFLHNLYVRNCTYSKGPIDEEKTVYADFTNAYNSYDVNYTWNKDQGQGYIGITKTIKSGGAGGTVTPGEELTYEIVYEAKNLDGILSNVYVLDILPDGVELVNCSDTYLLYDENDVVTGITEDAKSIKWELGNLKDGTNGSLTVTVKILRKASDTTITNKAGIIAELEQQEKWDEASIYVEYLEYTDFSVPDEFHFGNSKIESKKQYFGLDWQDSADKETGKNIIAVEDTRLGPAADWSLYVNLSGKVKDQDGAGNNILNDVLVYCEDGTETALSDSNLLIADKAKYPGEYNWISEDWYEDYEEQGQYPTDGRNAKGLYMVLQPGQGSINTGGSYKGEITWVFADTP